MSRYAEEIVAWADIGYLIHTEVVGDERLPLLRGPDPINVSILIKVDLRFADGLTGLIAHRAIEDRLGCEIKNQVFGFKFRAYGNSGGEAFMLLVKLC